jgi:hypothetical protein
VNAHSPDCKQIVEINNTFKWQTDGVTYVCARMRVCVERLGYSVLFEKTAQILLVGKTISLYLHI